VALLLSPNDGMNALSNLHDDVCFATPDSLERDALLLATTSRDRDIDRSNRNVDAGASKTRSTFSSAPLTNR
jgi:hypothetical protein